MQYAQTVGMAHLPPSFFVSAAAKGFRYSANCLEAKLAGIPQVLIQTRLQERGVCKKEAETEMEVLGELEGPGSGRASLEGRARIAPTRQTYKNMLVQFINDNFQSFGTCGIAWCWVWVSRGNQ
jgi:hypothetical protein